MFPYLLALHIAAGTVALLSGPVPMLSVKGSRLHRVTGDIYAMAMVIASVAAFILAIRAANILLLGIAVFTFFLVYSGFRALRLRAGAKVLSVDHVVCVLSALFSAWLLCRGVFGSDVVQGFFGAGGLALTFRMYQLLHRPAPNWLGIHLAFMGGAYIATVSAFLVVNIDFLPKPLLFIGPSFIGTPIIIKAAIRQKRTWVKQARAASGFVA